VDGAVGAALVEGGELESELLQPVSSMPIARPSNTIRTDIRFIDKRNVYQNPRADKQNIRIKKGRCLPNPSTFFNKRGLTLSKHAGKMLRTNSVRTIGHCIAIRMTSGSSIPDGLVLSVQESLELGIVCFMGKERAESYGNPNHPILNVLMLVFPNHHNHSANSCIPGCSDTQKSTHIPFNW
jgi:hypothetical protein